MQMRASWLAEAEAAGPRGSGGSGWQEGVKQALNEGELLLLLLLLLLLAPALLVVFGGGGRMGRKHAGEGHLQLCST
jgi:hypothetical protein